MFRYWLSFLIFLLLPFYSFATNELRISLLLINGNQRDAYNKVLKQFSDKHPDIELIIKAYESEYYKSQIRNWLSAESHSDVMYWFSGQRLRDFVALGWVKELDSLWEEEKWSRQFTKSARSSVTFNQHKYAIPVHYYPWAIYYKKSLFKRLNIPTPKTWEQFLQACETLKRNNITPIVLGSKNKWTLSAWFDFFNLRINGLKFHQDLITGKVSYKDPRIKTVFKYWRVLIDKGYFLEDHEHLTWRESVPYIYRDIGGMTLLGSFWTSGIPASFYNDIDIIRFPIINKDIPLYEQSPTDVFIIPANVKNKPEAVKLLRFLARSDVQEQLNLALGMLAPNPQHIKSDDHLLVKSYQILDQAAGSSQFYDRDNPEPISTKGIEQFASFVSDPDLLPDILDKLETLRATSFKTD